MSEMRRYSWLDQCCMSIDQALRAVADNAKTTGRSYPAEKHTESIMDATQRKHSAALMRINHTGEICAQALYHGQAMVSRAPQLKQSLQQAAIEEGDHLAWCRKRLFELGSHVSYLDPVWYAGSFSLGVAAGLVGDKWSLGFLAETEQQVVEHLQHHMLELKEHDQKSYLILQQMQHDEAVHRDEAIASGAHQLPRLVQAIMRFMSKVMVKTTYWV